MISFTCEGYHILPLWSTLPVHNSEDTIFIQFFFTIGSIGLVCDNKGLLNSQKYYHNLECLWLKPFRQLTMIVLSGMVHHPLLEYRAQKQCRPSLAIAEEGE